MPTITQHCRHSGSLFAIDEIDRAFYQKLGVPLPTLSPEERQRRRLAWRNERFLYNAKSARSGKPIISMYHPSSPFVVYDQSEWWSDEFDPLAYGKDFDFSRPFFEQFRELQHAVPRVNLTNTNSENSEYTNYTANNKNCYLIFSNSFGHNEDCAYGTCLQSSKDCIDSIYITKCELCKGLIDCVECFHLADSQDCERCSESYFLIDCRNCSYCFGCIGLRNKKYYFYNEQLSKETYEREIVELRLHTWSGYRSTHRAIGEFFRDKPRIYSRQYNAENCTGDYIHTSKNCTVAFDASDSEDVKFVQYCVKGEHDSMDCSYFGGGELNYEGLSIVEGYNCMFTNIAWWNVARLQYCELCFHSQDAVGCIGLKRHQYCIFNKQYSETEYKSLRDRIKEHMKASGEYGEFFPLSMSPFAYNETLAQEYFPLTKETALKQELKWRDAEPMAIMENMDMPDDYRDIDILSGDLILKCEITQKPFRIIPLERKVYLALNIALPRVSPDTRRNAMMSLRNPRKLWDRACMHCGKPIQTSYAPENPLIVWCDDCYAETVQ